MLLAISASVIVVLVLLWEVGWPVAAERIARWRASRVRIEVDGYDPGRERRAEVKARELLRSVVGDDLYAMYRDLGFIRMAGGGDSRSGYGYLLYPHRPIVAYEERSGDLLNEYCVVFPDESDPGLDSRLPDSDDVLAKWMALSGDERRLIADANMHVPGRQIDPMQVRRDLRRLGEWRGRRQAATVSS